jgi:hypothetical protein
MPDSTQIKRLVRFHNPAPPRTSHSSRHTFTARTGPLAALARTVVRIG